MQIRRLGAEDASVATRVIETMKTHGTDDPTQTTVSRFLSSDERYLIAALDDHNLPIGFLLAYELVRAERAQPMMLLYEIEVSEPWRRKGIATAMVTLLKGLCADRNVYKMWVETSKSNVAARNLYLGTGAALTTSDDCLSFTYTIDQD
jgi:aminoglycoside 3-N-acetyltransferase I